MEEVADLNRTELLIDFSSPVSKRLLDSPLIPIPFPPRQSLSVSPINSNPFDVVERQIAPSDPFECAFNNAFKDVNKNGQNLEENVQTVSSGRIFKSDNEKMNRSTIDVRTDVNPQVLCENNSVLSKNGQQRCVENEENCSQLLPAKIASESVVVSEADSQLQISVDLSTDEGIRAVIAKRVNKCIQKVLNNNLKSKLSHSNEHLNSNNKTSVKNNMNRRSVSFIMDSKKDKTCDRLNKSCADSSSNNDLFGNYQLLQNPDESSFGLCDMGSLNLTQGEVCKTEDSVSPPPTENDLVFHEAKKLARTFSKIADSFCKDTGSDNDDDLMSMKPRWLDSSSEDEEEKLRNDPALNIRVELTPTVPPRPDSKALSAYKSRARRSMSPQPQEAFQDETDSRKKAESRVSFPPARSLKPAVLPKVPSFAPVPVPVNLVNPETKSIRLKKNTAIDTKRGPMRAVMPIQSMTKDLINSEDKALANCNISPVRVENAVPSLETPKLEKCRMGARPVASSTPNKNAVVFPSPLLPPAAVPVQKRRSLGDEVNRKSRSSDISAGSRQRSNSLKVGPVYSKIPAPAGTRGNSSLTLKSTSNLRNTSFSSPQRAVSSEDKHTNVKTSFNPRALLEVKPKPSPKNGRVKATMSVISGFMAGKNKKPASQEKENRFPH